MRVLFVPNLKARKTSPHHIELLMHVAPLYDGEVDVLPENWSAAEMEALVRKHLEMNVYERVICFGGDGTINRVVRAMQGHNIPLGIIPTGTANLLSSELNLPTDPQAALEIALVSGRPRKLDLGTINGVPFVDMAGFGFDGRVVNSVDAGVKNIIGPFAYIAAAIKELATYKKSRFIISGEKGTLEIDAWLLVAANLTSYGNNNVKLVPSAKSDDGYLDFCVFTEDTAITKLSQIGSAIIGNTAQHEHIHTFKAKNVKITTDPEVEIQVDGDYFGKGEAEINVLPGALLTIEKAQDDV